MDKSLSDALFVFSPGSIRFQNGRTIRRGIGFSIPWCNSQDPLSGGMDRQSIRCSTSGGWLPRWVTAQVPPLPPRRERAGVRVAIYARHRLSPPSPQSSPPCGGEEVNRYPDEQSSNQSLSDFYIVLARRLVREVVVFHWLSVRRHRRLSMVVRIFSLIFSIALDRPIFLFASDGVRKRFSDAEHFLFSIQRLGHDFVFSRSGCPSGYL